MPDADLPGKHPETIGPYHIVRVIGQGGMGVVYEAEQLRPVRRRVALKMMRDGLDSREVVGRFEAERQALAVMEHPGIAKVLDAGVSESGRPYFVMELVRGIRIDEYCDRYRQTLTERIGLFIQLCLAVQHAHQKGIIHRDLKPSNVLVTEQGGSAVPKIIDFGIAKATGQRLTDATFVTTLGQAVGTLAYMSPEQAEGSELDVDTRSDIYSLGVILYQLLVGWVPVDPRDTGVPAFLARLVTRETSFPAPSERLASTDDETRKRAATARGLDPSGLKKHLDGDLRWIVMTAMEKDRSRRYETANALALDLQRYLADDPVRARPPSAAYRIGKFTRRHRAAVLAGSVAAVALVAGTVATSVGFLRARRAESEALAAENKARTQAETARQVSNFLIDLFEVNDPGESRGETVTAREILDRGARRVDRELAGQPLVQARMMAAMGSVYQGLGLYDDALSLLQRALSLREANLPANDLEVAESLERLGSLQRERGDLESAEESHRKALAIREATLGPEDELVGRSLSQLGATLLSRGHPAEADSLLSRALAIEEKSASGQDTRVAGILQNLGTVAYYQSDYPKAAQYYSRSIAIRERLLGKEDPSLADALNNLGAVSFMEGKYQDALKAYQRVHDIYTQTLPPDHPRLGTILTNLGETYLALGRDREAEPLLLKALDIKQRALSPDEPGIAVTLRVLADVYRDQGRFREAEARYKRAIQITEDVFGPDHPRLAEPLKAYAEMLKRAGRNDEAARVEARRAALSRDSAGG